MSKGLSAQVFRSALTGGSGISSHDSVVLIERRLPFLVEPDTQHPALYLERSPSGQIIAVPVARPRTTRYVFGGCFVWSDDRRFGEISSSPIPVFDREEAAPEQQGARACKPCLDYMTGELVREAA